jgi:hypothetical protein
VPAQPQDGCSSTDLGAERRLRDLSGDQRHRLPNEILKPVVADLRDNIGNRHALTTAHRGVSSTSTAGTADEFGAHGGRPTQRSI